MTNSFEHWKDALPATRWVPDPYDTWREGQAEEAIEILKELGKEITPEALSQHLEKFFEVEFSVEEAKKLLKSKWLL